MTEPAGGIDVPTALERFGSNTGAARIAYQQLVAPTTDVLIAELARSEPATWLATAVDDFGMQIGDLALACACTPSPHLAGSDGRALAAGVVDAPRREGQAAQR